MFVFLQEIVSFCSGGSFRLMPMKTALNNSVPVKDSCVMTPRKIRKGNFLYMAAITASVALLTLYALAYFRLSTTQNQSEKAAALSQLMHHINAFRLAVNESEYQINLFLSTGNTAVNKEISKIDQQAEASVGKLKELCSRGVIPCDSGITRLDSLYRLLRNQVAQVLATGSSGKRNYAQELRNDTRYDFLRLALAEEFNKIVKTGNDKLRETHAHFDEDTRGKYQLLLVLSVTTVLLLVFIIWRFRSHLSWQDRSIQALKDMEASGGGMVAVDHAYRITYINRPAERLLGVEGLPMEGRNVFDLVSDEGQASYRLIRRELENCFARKEFYEFVFQHSAANRWLKVTMTPETDSYSFFIKDITDIKKAEEELRKSRRLYAFISRCNDLVLNEHDESVLYDSLCKMAVKEGGFLFAWVGGADAENVRIVPEYHAGKSHGYLSELNINLHDAATGNGPTGRAYKTGQYYCSNDIAHDPVMAPWAAQAVMRGFYASISLPVILNRTVAKVWTLYADRPYFFTEEEQQLLVRVAHNISYAISNLRTEQERKKIQQQLQMVNQAIEQSAASVVITNVQGNIEYVNQAFTRLTGYAMEEVLGQNPRVLKTGYTTPFEYAKLWDDITNFREWRGEFMNKKKNGETYWEQATISPIIDEKGAITHFLAVKENISERKKLEERNQLLLDIIENTNAYIAMGDLDERMTYFNKAFRDALEIGDADAGLFTAADFRDNPGRLMKQEIKDTLLKTGKWIGENQYRSRSGKLVPVMQVVVLHKNSLGDFTHYSTTAIDMTRIRESEQNLQKLNKELREFASHLQSVREVEKNRIMNEVHDELGQGLAALMFDVNWIKKHLNDEKAVVEQKVDALIQSISDRLKSFLKIYSSANPELLKELGLFGAVQSLVTTFLRSANTEIRFRSNLQHENINGAVSLAIYRIVQEALRNIQLYANARHAALVLQRKKDTILLTVEDDGNGFDLSRVDTRFHYGILEMRERVYALNGQFDIESEPGKGTKVVVTIPVNDAPDEGGLAGNRYSYT